MITTNQFDTQISKLEQHLGRKLPQSTRQVWFDRLQSLSNSELSGAIALLLCHLKPFSDSWPSANDILQIGNKLKSDRQVQRLKGFCKTGVTHQEVRSVFSLQR